MASMSLLDKQLSAILLILGLVIFLFQLSTPRSVVFDEVHFGKFITSYCCSGERFFDIHPPHAKLLIAGGAYLGGYRGGFSFQNIGQLYGSIPIAALRLVPALAGIAIPLIIFALLRLAKVSPPVAFLGGLAMVFDNALVLQSRVIALDSLLLASTFGSLALFLWARVRGGRDWGLFIASGALAGFAAGTKFTGLVAIGLLGVLVLLALLQAKGKREIERWVSIGVLILIGAIATYLAGWLMHFTLLTSPGSGDAWGIPTGTFWPDLVQIHKQMLGANYNLEATHPYSSPWWSWPIMRRPVFYWSGTEGAWLYFLGNPAVWWGTSLLFVAAVLATIRQKKIQAYEAGVFLAGYVIAYLPFLRVPRALFLYHYLTPLLFSLLFGLWWLDKTVKHEAWSKKQGSKLRITNYELRKLPTWYWLVLAVIVGGFILFSPITYGFASPEWQNFLMWLPTWR